MDAAAHPSVPQRLVEGLNEPQRTAVETLSGPLLVVAGPGSGKTRVLTHRIGALLASGVPAREILAVTFTNKAAAEMRNRLAGLVGEEALRGMWVATFHSACVKLLRIEHEAAGIPRDFSILDDRDTLAVLKEQAAIQGLVYEPAELKTAAGHISFAKNHGEGPEAAAARYRDAGLGTLMAAYDKKLAQMGALDFDDLLLRAWAVLRDDEEVRSRWQRRFSHVLVDEYQDTNAVQFSIVRAIAAGTRNICVVGDLDQAIYSWRGSSPEIMAGFTAEYPEAKVVVLEENYRSTKAILAVAQAVIDANPAPWRARLHTGNDEGSPARLYVADDDRDEASFIVDEIQATGEPLGRHAVLVRTNAQTRVLEEELNRRGLPYAVVGALRFYDRAEIKDALAYLRLAMNPADTASFLRCANTPRRGLGPAALDAVAALADAQGITVLDAARACGSGAGGVTRRAAESLAGFVELVDAVTDAAEDGPKAAIEACVVRTGLREAVGRAADGVGRVENLDELRSAAARFEGGPVPTSPEILEVAELDGREASRAFLENVTLVSSEDLAGDGTGSVEKVQILTAHSAKGKEFGHVFVAGLEQNLFPHSRSIGNDAEMAEERRLLFVACSRAEETLTLTRCAQRMLYGNKLSFNEPSVFLSDIDHLLVEVASRRGRTRWRDPHAPRRAHPAGVRPGGQGRSAGAVAARRAVAEHALLAPRTAPLEPVAPRGGPRLGAEQLAVGQRVRHATFGVGVVESVDAVRKMVRISFGAVRKDLMLEYAPLEQA